MQLQPMEFLNLVNYARTAFFICCGAIIASFWAVVAMRVNQKRDWMWSRSECDWCHHLISWWENIPILSFVILRGKCRHCHKRIKFSYFAWETLLGIWVAYWIWNCSPLGAYLDATNLDILPAFWSQMSNIIALAGSISLLAVGAILIWTAIVDVETHEIANGWLYAVGGLTVIHLIFTFYQENLWINDLIVRLMQCVAVGGLFWLIDLTARKIWGRPGIGSGDTILLMILAWWLTLGQLTVAVLLSFWIGAIVGLALLGVSRYEQRELREVAFLPFINLAFLISYFFGEEIFAWLIVGQMV